MNIEFVKRLLRTLSDRGFIECPHRAYQVHCIPSVKDAPMYYMDIQTAAAISMLYRVMELVPPQILPLNSSAADFNFYRSAESGEAEMAVEDLSLLIKLAQELVTPIVEQSPPIVQRVDRE